MPEPAGDAPTRQHPQIPPHEREPVLRGPARRAVMDLVEEAEEKHHFCVAQTSTQSRQLSRAVSGKILTRPFPGVYATRERWERLSKEERVLYGARALSLRFPSWVFAGPTAAVAHGLWVGWDYLSAIYVATSAKSHSADTKAIKRIEVTGDTAVMRDSLRVTSFARTIYDCVRLMSFPDALAVVDSALRTKGISGDRLAENLRRSVGSRRDLGRVLEVIGYADARSENGGESVARAHMVLLGFAVPELQVELVDAVDGQRKMRVDYLWRLADETIIAGELDGREKYVNPEMTAGGDVSDVLLAERRREAHLTLSNHSVRVMRFSLAEAKDSAVFERLLSSYGVPRQERPLVVGRLS